MDQEGRILANIDLSRRIYLAYRPLVCTYARLTLCSVGYASLTPLEPEMDGWHAWRNSPQPKKQLVAAASAAARVACLTSNCRLPVRWILRPDPICRWRSEAQPQQREALVPRRAAPNGRSTCFASYHRSARCRSPQKPAGSVTRGTATERTEEKEAGVVLRSCTSQLTTTGSDERARDLDESDLKGSNVMTRVPGK
jgi:hypothetical protein